MHEATALVMISFYFLYYENMKNQLKRQQSRYNPLCIFDTEAGCYIREVQNIFFKFNGELLEIWQGRIENNTTEAYKLGLERRVNEINLKGDLEKKLKIQAPEYQKEYYTIEKKEYSTEKNAFVFLKADNITKTTRTTAPDDYQKLTYTTYKIEYNNQVFIVEKLEKIEKTQAGEELETLKKEIEELARVDISCYELEKLLKVYNITKK